ncbi:MAG: hypothetical protein ACMXYL_00030 [Candidatus Woesearchaeota archaeon]
MVYTPKKAVYVSDKGMVIEVLPITVDELAKKMPQEELSYPGFRAIEHSPKEETYAAIAIPPHDPQYAEFVKPKAYIAGRTGEGTVYCTFVKAADYARGQKIGRIMVAHDILSAAQDTSIQEYAIKTNHSKIKELLSSFGFEMNTMGRKKGLEEKVIMDFSDDEERDRIRRTASSWLVNYRASQ